MFEICNKIVSYIRTKFFRKKVPAWGIDWDEAVMHAAQRMADQIDIDVLDMVYKDVEKSASYWVKLQAEEVRRQICAGLNPQIFEKPPAIKEVVKGDKSYTQVTLRCSIGDADLTLECDLNAIGSNFNYKGD